MATPRLHITPKPRQHPRTVARIAAALDTGALPHHQPLTAHLVTRATGLPVDEARWGLLELASQRPARISSNSAGELAIELAPIPPPPVSKPSQLFRSAHRFISLLLLVLAVPPLALTTATHAVGLAIALPDGAVQTVVGLLLFLPYGFIGCMAALMMVCQALALGGGLLIVAGVLLIVKAVSEGFQRGNWGEAAMLIALCVLVFMGTGGYLLRVTWRAFQEALNDDEKTISRAWRFLAALLFGPRGEHQSELADEQLMVRNIERSAGVISTWDVVAWFGVLPGEADSHVARVLVDYGGDVMVTDTGEVLFVFPQWQEGRSRQRSETPHHAMKARATERAGERVTAPSTLADTPMEPTETVEAQRTRKEEKKANKRAKKQAKRDKKERKQRKKREKLRLEGLNQPSAGAPLGVEGSWLMDSPSLVVSHASAPTLLPDGGALWLLLFAALPLLGAMASPHTVAFPSPMQLLEIWPSVIHFNESSGVPAVLFQGLGAWPYAVLLVAVGIRLPTWRLRLRSWRTQGLVHAIARATHPTGSLLAEDTDTALLAQFHGDIALDTGLPAFPEAQRHHAAAALLRRQQPTAHHAP